MKVSAYIPALGQQEILDECVELLATNSTLSDTKLFVIDNASKTPLKSQYAFIIRNEENAGMVGSLRQAVQHSDADVLCYLHSDMFIFEPGWDAQILQAFEADPKLGMLGVVGAEVAEANGGRSLVHCAFRDWVKHGHKPTKKITPVAILDGCCLIMRRELLLTGDLLDETLPSHHFYDKSLSLAFTMASHRVGVIDLDCAHISGQTSCRPEYQDWAQKNHGGDDMIYHRAEQHYLNKWGPCFPVRVMPDWTVHVGRK